MIDLSQDQLITLLISSFLCGVLLGVVYEGIRLLKLIFTVKGKMQIVLWHIFTFLTDFLFVMFFAVTAILLTNQLCGGVFRGMTYVGMLSGLLLYFFTIGKLTLKISKKVSQIIKRVIKSVIKIICIPIRAFFSLVFKLYTLTIGKIIDKIIDRIKEKSSLQHSLPANTELPAIQECKEEKGYKKEGRISFGGTEAS